MGAVKKKQQPWARKRSGRSFDFVAMAELGEDAIRAIVEDRQKEAYLLLGRVVGALWKEARRQRRPRRGEPLERVAAEWARTWHERDGTNLKHAVWRAAKMLYTDADDAALELAQARIEKLSREPWAKEFAQVARKLSRK